MREELAEGANQVVHAPSDLVLFVGNLLPQEGAVAFLVRLECVLGDLRGLVVATGVVHG